MKTNDFDECRVLGEKWEAPICEKLCHFFFDLQSKALSFAEFPEMQRSGIDAIIMQRDDIEVDTKIRSKETHRYYNKDICIEEEDGIPGNDGQRPDESIHGHPGWHFKLMGRAEESDWNTVPLAIFCWETLTGRNLEPVGYILPYTQGWCEWWQENRHRFLLYLAKSYRRGHTWYTRSRYPFVGELSLHNFITKFNPRSAIGSFSGQKKLCEYDKSIEMKEDRKYAFQ